MALIATVAVAVTAVLAAVATGGHEIGGFTVTPVLYGLGLAPGVLAVALGRRPPVAAVPPRAAKGARVALLFVALYLFSGRGQPPGVVGLVAGLGLSVVAISVLWPQPAALRLSLAFSVVSLLGPGTAATDRPGALVAMATVAAVALVSTGRSATGAVPALGGIRPSPRPRRTAGEAAVVAAVLAVAALASILVDPLSPAQGRSGPEPGSPAREQEPAPLALLDHLDPADQGRGVGAGRDGDGDGTADGDEVVLRVDADRPDVWRAQVFDHWDGRRWRGRAGGGGAALSRRPFVVVPLDSFERSPTDQLTQRVEVEADFAAVAVGAPKAYLFELPGGATVAPDGTVLPVPALGRGATYVTTSGRSPATPSMLRAAGAAAATLAGDASLAVPGLSERAGALAARVTAGAASSYDAVGALESWLAAHVEVDDDVAALPPGADVVDRVLFTERAGSPERLATALAVLVRSAGVPARVATGFLPGRRPLFGGEFVVRARDAHAWVEVPFPGLGWQRFDATGRIAAAERENSLLTRVGRLLARWWPVLAAVGVAAAAVAVRAFVLRRRRRRAIPWATRYFARLARVGAKRGRPRRPSETPAEYTAVLAEGVLADDRLRDVGALVTSAAWSGREPPDDARRWAEDVLRETAGAGRRRSR